MTHILFISHYLQQNGTETFMMNVVRGLRSANYHFDFLVFDTCPSSYSRELEQAGCTIYRLHPRRSGWVYWADLYRFFRLHASEYQVIHWCGGTLSSILPIRMAKWFGIPVRIVHAHNSQSAGWHNRLLHRLHRRAACRLATHALACSQDAASYFFAHHPSTIIPNGIHCEMYAYQPEVRECVRQQLGLQPEEILLGHIGRFEPVKNQSFLLSVLASIPSPHTKLLLVGNGSMREQVQQQAQQMGLNDRILWIAQSDEIYRLTQAMDAFVMPSLFEGLPFVLLEAQAAGLPCFISDTIHSHVCLTPWVQSLSLHLAPAQWAERIGSTLLHHQRQDGADYIRQAGYDLSDIARQMTQIYDSYCL